MIAIVPYNKWTPAITPAILTILHEMWPLLLLKLLAHAVRHNFAPVYLGARDGQLPPQGLEGGLAHGLVVLADGRLVVVLGILNQLHQLFGGLLLALREGKWYCKVAIQL